MLKKFFLVIFILVFAPPNLYAAVEITAANFPDDAFRERVRSFDTDGDMILSNEEISAVTVIYAAHNRPKIISMDGIEYFTALKELDCNDNAVKALDLKANTNLEFLFCISMI